VARGPFLECLETAPDQARRYQEEHAKRYERMLLRNGGKLGDWSDRESAQAELHDKTRSRVFLKRSEDSEKRSGPQSLVHRA